MKSKDLNLKSISLLIIFILALAVPVYAGHGYAGDYAGCAYDGQKSALESKLFHKAHFILENRDEIGLSEEQADQIKAIKLDVKKGVIRQDAEIDVIKLDIMSLLQQETIDTAAVNKLIDEKYKIKKAKAKTLVDQYAKLKSVLTSEQHAAMKEIWKKNK
ncbi:hypothetical protein N9K06_00930 [Omnitrophica bacterium]|nr:hypothetical protein [Candidatus Omnitrophota bacterium]